MSEYSRKFGSQFPNSVMKLHNYEDITSATYPLVKKYTDYCMNGDLESANLLLLKNPNLKKSLFGSDDINLLDEERYNLQVYAQEKGQFVSIDESEPISPKGGLVWIGGD